MLYATQHGILACLQNAAYGDVWYLLECLRSSGLIAAGQIIVPEVYGLISSTHPSKMVDALQELHILKRRIPDITDAICRQLSKRDSKRR